MRERECLKREQDRIESKERYKVKEIVMEYFTSRECYPQK